MKVEDGKVTFCELTHIAGTYTHIPHTHTCTHTHTYAPSYTHMRTHVLICLSVCFLVVCDYYLGMGV